MRLVNSDKLIKTIVLGIISGCISVIAFGATANDSEALELQKTLADDPNLELLLEGDLTQEKKIYLRSLRQAYQLTCERSAGLLSLVRATGVSTDLLPLARVYSDVSAIGDVDERVNGALNCKNEGVTIRKIERILPGDDEGDTQLTEYFITFVSEPTRLHRIGCQGLIDAMSLTLDDARLISTSDIGNIFSLNDKDQIRCQNGEIPNPRDRGLIISQRDIAARFGREIVPITVRDSINEDAAPSNLQIVENTCGDWLQLQDGDLMGTPPLETEITNNKCDIALTATAGDVRYRKEYIRFAFSEDRGPIWNSPSAKLAIHAAPGKDIPDDVHVIAVDPDDAEPPTITMVPEEACRWVKGEQKGNRFELTGTAPSENANKTCKVFLDATSHNLPAKRRFEIVIHITSGVSLIWTAPAENPTTLQPSWIICAAEGVLPCGLGHHEISLGVNVAGSDGAITPAEKVTMSLAQGYQSGFSWCQNATIVGSSATSWKLSIPYSPMLGGSCHVYIRASARAPGSSEPLEITRRQKVQFSIQIHSGRLNTYERLLRLPQPLGPFPDINYVPSTEDMATFSEKMLKPSEEAHTFEDRCLSDLARSIVLSTEDNIVNFVDPQCDTAVDYQSLLDNKDQLREIDTVFENKAILDALGSKKKVIFDQLMQQE